MKTRLHSPGKDNADSPAPDSPESNTAEERAAWIVALKRLIALARRLKPDGSLKDE